MPRDEMMYDGRRMPPRNSRGEFRRRRRGDRAMYDEYDMARGGRGRDRGMSDYEDGRVIRSYPRRDMGEYDMARDRDMRSMDYRGGDYRSDEMMGDGHYMHGGRRGGYEPVEFMGYCEGYYGAPDHARGDYGYDMRGGDYARGGRRDYGYDYAYGDYGETLSEKEIEHWEKKLMAQLDEREKQMFAKQVIIPKFKQMGIEMTNFNEEELYVATLAKYTDHKASIGQNPDLAIKLARDFMIDPDSNVKGSERLAVYYDTFVDD